jgi:hypothetical protein
VAVDQLTIERLIAEIQVYYEQETESGSKEEGLMQLRDVEEKLLKLKYAPTSRKRKLSYTKDLVYLAHARLLISDFKASGELLDKAKAVLNTVSAIPQLPIDVDGLTDKEIKRRDELHRPEIEILKGIRFLESFILEQRAYQSFMQGDLFEASGLYKQIKARKVKVNLDVQLDQLINRVSMMQACIAIKQNQLGVAQQLRVDIMKSLSDLLEDHPGAKRLAMLNEQITNNALTLPQQLDCKDTRFIVFPLRKVESPQS